MSKVEPCPHCGATRGWDLWYVDYYYGGVDDEWERANTVIFTPISSSLLDVWGPLLEWEVFECRACGEVVS